MSFTWGRPVEILAQFVCVVAVATILSICAVTKTPLGTNGDLAGLLYPASGLLALMIVARACVGRTLITTLGINFALFALISLLAAIASAAVAIGHVPYVDAGLGAADHHLAPWYDWAAVARGLTTHSGLQLLLTYFYVSLNWQPFLLFGAVAIGIIQIDRLDRFVAAWGVSLAITIIVFHWLPARGAYLYYGIRHSDLPGMKLDLPWQYPESLAHLRAVHPVIDRNGLNGIVTVPSFHACAAVLLAWAFAHSRLLRWPMVLLNAGMVTSAVTMGGHYLVDIVAGVTLALGAIAVACTLDGDPIRWKARWLTPKKPVAPSIVIRQTA